MHTIYLLDDDALILEELNNLVPWLDNGFDVIGQNTMPEIAIGEVIDLKPDVIFTDLKMPKIDGIDFLKQIKELGFKGKCVMISAYPSFQYSREFFRLEGFDYILKPFQLDEIQIVLERISSMLSPIETTAPIDTTSMPTSFAKLIAHISTNYSKKFTLNGLGKEFGISSNYICNLFAKHYNTSLTRFLTDIRMKNAATQIKNGKYSLKEIALNCGYSEYYYFCKVFKEYWGVSPTSYAKNGSEKESTI